MEKVKFRAAEPILQSRPSGRRKRPGHRLLLSLSGVLMSLFLAGCFLLYGPLAFCRELWINTAMETMTHRWLAGVFYDQKTINAVMAKSVVNIPIKSTDPGLVKEGGANVPKDNATELPQRPEDGEKIINGIGFTKLRGEYGNGWLIKVYDPSRLTMGVSRQFGTRGEHVTDMMTRLNGFVGINASGFIDLGGHGSGGEPDQAFLYNGKFLRSPSGTGTHHFIGITKQNKLVLGDFTKSEIDAENFKYGIEFSPFLIMNGKALNVSYYSFQPRTAIGQTKDGVFLFVVIDGRSVLSRGATMEDVQKIMLANGAVNAANLDGGSSSVFAYKGKVINRPSGPAGERYLPDAFLITYPK